jgi:2-haloacid dehalogenase
MSNAPLNGVKACVFDAYGTLFDFAAAAKGCRDVLGESIDKLTALWRDKQLQYTWLRALRGRHADFWQVTSDALDFALETLAIDKPGLRDRLMNLYLTLDAFPEVRDALTRLKRAGLRTAILSNGSPKMLDAAVQAAGLNSLLDAVLSVEEVGVYKPHPKVYQLAVDRLAVPAAAIAFQSSNAWDAYAASAFGHQVGMPTKRRNTMNRLATLVMTTVSLLFVGVALLAGDGIGYAQQRSDSDNVNAAVNAFHAALSNLDIGKMQTVWAQEPYVVLINPRDKAPAVGWDAVKKDWQDGVFGFWAELKLTPKQAPQIHINQGVASTTGVVGVEGKNKSGQALSFTIIETQVYEKRGDRWLMISHHASRVPE